MEKDIFKKERELIEERKKSLKHGHNVIHLKYVGVFTENDLKEISENLSKSNLELSSFDSSRITTNSFDDFSFITYLALSQPLIIELLKGISTNAVWDVIKETVIYTRNKVLGKKIYKVTSRGAEEKEITFGLKVHLDKNTSFDFEVKGDLSEEIINQSLDKVLDFMKSQKINPEYKHPLYMKFSKKEQKWIAINVLEEIRKKNKKK